MAILAQAAAESNRYNERKIAIADRDVAASRVGGHSRTNDTVGFVAALAKTLPVAAATGDNGEIRLHEARLADPFATRIRSTSRDDRRNRAGEAVQCGGWFVSLHGDRRAALGDSLLPAWACVLLTTGPGHAAPPSRHTFRIADQSLGDALRVYARQSGRQVLFPYDTVQGKRAPPIVGECDDDAALRRLAEAASWPVPTTGSP